MTKCDLDISLFPHAADVAAAARQQTGKTAIFESRICIIFSPTSLIMSRLGEKNTSVILSAPRYDSAQPISLESLLSSDVIIIIAFISAGMKDGIRTCEEKKKRG